MQVHHEKYSTVLSKPFRTVSFITGFLAFCLFPYLNVESKCVPCIIPDTSKSFH